MPDVTATDAARRFSDLLDAVEHDGADFTVLRHGKAIAHIEPIRTSNGESVKNILRRHPPDTNWAADLAATRSLLETEERE